MEMPPPKLPSYDIAEWKQLPFPDRMKFACQSWAEDGYGTPSVSYVIYNAQNLFLHLDVVVFRFVYTRPGWAVINRHLVDCPSSVSKSDTLEFAFRNLGTRLRQWSTHRAVLSSTWWRTLLLETWYDENAVRCWVTNLWWKEENSTRRCTLCIASGSTGTSVDRDPVGCGIFRSDHRTASALGTDRQDAIFGVTRRAFLDGVGLSILRERLGCGFQSSLVRRLDVSGNVEDQPAFPVGCLRDDKQQPDECIRPPTQMGVQRLPQ